MKNYVLQSLAIAFLVGSSLAQTANAPQGAPASAAEPLHIAPGSVIPVQLPKTLDVKKAKSGDTVETRVTQDLKSDTGELILSKDTRIVGHLTQAQAHGKDQESQLAIAFDHAVLKDGESLPLPLSIQAVIAPPGSNTTAGNNSSGQSSYSGGMAPAGRSMGGSSMSPTAPSNSDDTSANAPAQANPRPQITGNTQGVIGISHLTLAAGSNAAQGSLLSSDKNNVKLESGTFLLLRVGQ